MACFPEQRIHAWIAKLQKENSLAVHRKFNVWSDGPCELLQILASLGERQVKIDCDVIQADGGTRTASITGAWIALSIACELLLQKGAITSQPLRDQVAAVSCGVTEAGAVL